MLGFSCGGGSYRSGHKKSGSVNAKEFKQAFGENWLKLLPKREVMRFDDECFFKINETIMVMRIQFIAGEAPRHMGKHIPKSWKKTCPFYP